MGRLEEGEVVEVAFFWGGVVLELLLYSLLCLGPKM